MLLDQNAPRGLRQILIGYDVRTTYEMGWSTLSNGLLLEEAERSGFSVLITGDRNIRSQQNLTGRRIALVVLSTNHWVTIQSNPQPVIDAMASAGEGAYVKATFPRPPRLRRPAPKREQT